jgi:hypothetical protein
VQIWVVVASIQMRSLKAVVGKGSVFTALGHGLAGPEGQLNSVKLVGCSQLNPASKGNQVKIPELNQDLCVATQVTIQTPLPPSRRVLFSS